MSIRKLKHRSTTMMAGKIGGSFECAFDVDRIPKRIWWWIRYRVTCGRRGGWWNRRGTGVDGDDRLNASHGYALNANHVSDDDRADEANIKHYDPQFNILRSGWDEAWTRVQVRSM